MEFKLKETTKIFLFSLLTIACLSLSYGQSNKNIKYKYNKANQLIKELNWFEAKDLLIEITQEKEDYAPAFYKLGIIENHFKDYEKALSYFDKVIKINNDHVTDAYFEIGKIKWSFKDFEGAETALDHVIENDKTNSEAFYLRGKMKYDEGEFELASNDFEVAILYNSDETMYYFDRALTRIELRKYKGAINDLNKVISENPEMAGAYFSRGNAYYLEGSSPDFNHHHQLFLLALEDYNQAIKLDPELEPAYFNRGETHMRLAEEVISRKSHYIDAIADFKHALALDPNDKEAHLLKALCNYHYGYETVALKEFEEITVIDPEYADAYYDIAVINYEFGKPDKALELFNKLISIEKAHDDAFLYRGYTYLELDDKENACLDFEKADQLGNKEAHKDIQKYCKSINKKKKKKE